MEKQIFDFANFERTGNNAIDLVAQAVGWARANHKPIKAVRLSPGYFDLFRLGLEVLARSKGVNLELTGLEVLEFDGVNVNRGTGSQFEKLIIDWYGQTPLPSTSSN